MSKSRRSFFLGVIFAILCLTIALRFSHLSLRPLHSDEGVNFNFFLDIFKKGYYPYSHQNYHGPLYFYVSAFFVWILGENEFGLRFSSALFGLLTVFSPFCLRKQLGFLFACISSALLAISPSLVFYSRYAIHETMFVFFQFWFAAALYSWLRDQKNHWIYQGAIALAGLMSLKETFVITFVSCGLGAVASADKPTVLFKQLWQARKKFYLAYLLFIAVLFSCFSAGFRWFPGILEMLRAFPQWVGRGTSSDVGHFKPMLYYVNNLIYATEPFLLIIPVLCIAGSMFYQPMYVVLKSAWSRYVGVWCCVNLLAYSLIPYKTPWLVINMVLPLILFTSNCLTQMLESCKKPAVLGGLIAVGLTFCSGLRSTLLYNFDAIELFGKSVAIPGSQPYGPQNPFSYVHTARGMLDLLDDIKNYRRENPEAKVLIAVSSYWPLPFYLKEYPNCCAYLKTEDLDAYKDEYSILIADHKNQWSDARFQMKYYRLSDVQESHVYFRRSEAVAHELTITNKIRLYSARSQYAQFVPAFYILVANSKARER